MASARFAINGFGRIGRLFFRQAFGDPDIDIVAINDLGDIENLAYLLQYDSVYRRYAKSVQADKERNVLIVDGKEIKVIAEKDPAHLPWKDLNIDVVVESTGLFESFEKASVHIASGARRVVITAPAKDDEGTAGGKTILMGVNEKELGSCVVSSNGSCTTNSVASVVSVLSDNPGILKAMLTTTHAFTATQTVVDGPVRGGSDYRRGRSASQNIAPSTTGAAIAVTRALPDLKGKFDGLSFRVPVATGSLSTVIFLAKRPTTVEEVNGILEKAASDPRWADVLRTTRDQLVSTDIIGESHTATVDLALTKVVDGDLVSVSSWYDNEYSYVATLVAHARRAAGALS